MTASSSIEPITSTNTTATTSSDAIVSSGISRLYHSIRTASPPASFGSEVPSLQTHETVATATVHILNMKRHCGIDPPGRNSDGEESDDEEDNSVNGDDPSYDWSSISSMDDDDEEEEELDDDCSMADAPKQQEQQAIAPTPMKRRKVTFGMMEVYEVPSLSDYQMEDNTPFWYTTMDMISTRRAGRLATMHDASVKNYLYYYEFLYRKLQSNNTTYSNKEVLLSELDAKILAYGLRGGYQGLERESKFEQVRQDERRSVVKLIVDAYKRKQEHGLESATVTSNDDAEALRTFAVSLTNTMSQWAASLGQAAHLAIDTE